VRTNAISFGHGDGGAASSLAASFVTDESTDPSATSGDESEQAQRQMKAVIARNAQKAYQLR